MQKRIFYFDFIRVLSTLMIFVYHFSVRMPLVNITGALIPFITNCNSTWGIPGVAIFFMLSGAGLMLKYDTKEKINLSSFFKNRIGRLYPIYWITYILAFIYFYFKYRGMVPYSPLRFIFTIIGIDGFLSFYTSTFYILGEWFLGVLILYYILFPVFFKMIKRFPILLFSLSLIIFLSSFIFFEKTSVNPITCSFSFILGMFFVKYFMQHISEWKYIIGPSVLAFVIIFIKLPMISIFKSSSSFYGMILGWCLFIVLAAIGNTINNKKIQFIFNKISPMTYGMFLIHHVVIIELLTYFGNQFFQIRNTIVVFSISIILTALIAVLAQKILNKIELFIKEVAQQ